MSQNPNQSYLSLLQNMREILLAKYSQKPQLSASHPIDTNLQFIFKRKVGLHCRCCFQFNYLHLCSYVYMYIMYLY